MNAAKEYYIKLGKFDKFREYREKYKTKYRKETGSGQYDNRPWTEQEVEMILKHELSDRELSKELRRSVQAIQVKRCKLKNKSKKYNQNKF